MDLFFMSAFGGHEKKAFKDGSTAAEYHALKVAIPFFNAYIERYQEKPAENITEIETTNEVTGDVHTETSMIPSNQTEVEADHENKLTSTKYCYK